MALINNQKENVLFILSHLKCNMNKELVPHEPLLKMIELGFNVEKPTLLEAFNWFREKQNLASYTIPFDGYFEYAIQIDRPSDLSIKLKNVFASPRYYSMRDAELSCLDHMIKIVQESLE
jgi:hypothetical protein